MFVIGFLFDFFYRSVSYLHVSARKTNLFGRGNFLAAFTEGTASPRSYLPIISRQVMGDTAKQLSECFGKIMRDRESLSINASETSVCRSKQPESAILPSAVSSLSSGEFVGMVADDPAEKIDLKIFHPEILNDHAALKAEEDAYLPIPKIRKITQSEIEDNYLQIKEEVMAIVESEMERIYDTPELGHLLVAREE